MISIFFFFLGKENIYFILFSFRKGLNMEDVSSEDREHAKRIIYSVIYGAG